MFQTTINDSDNSKQWEPDVSMHTRQQWFDNSLHTEHDICGLKS